MGTSPQGLKVNGGRASLNWDQDTVRARSRVHTIVTCQRDDRAADGTNSLYTVIVSPISALDQCGDAICAPCLACLLSGSTPLTTEADVSVCEHSCARLAVVEQTDRRRVQLQRSSPPCQCCLPCTYRSSSVLSSGRAVALRFREVPHPRWPLHPFVPLRTSFHHGALVFICTPCQVFISSPNTLFTRRCCLMIGRPLN